MFEHLLLQTLDFLGLIFFGHVLDTRSFELIGLQAFRFLATFFALDTINQVFHPLDNLLGFDSVFLVEAYLLGTAALGLANGLLHGLRDTVRIDRKSVV